MRRTAALSVALLAASCGSSLAQTTEPPVASAAASTAAASLASATASTANTSPAAATASMATTSLASPAASAAVAVVDGCFADWDQAELRADDARADGLGLDLVGVAFRSDSERVSFLIELEPESNLQGGNRLRLVIDGDGDPDTGEEMDGLGAELVWTFGERSGRGWIGADMRSIEQHDVGLLQAPTVSSHVFEVSFARRSLDGGPILPGPEIAFALYGGSGGDADRLPDEGFLRAALSDAPPAPAPEVSLERRRPDDVRVLTYNVLFDGLFKRPAAFIRILRAINPDIICFQEIWSHTARQAADQVSLAIPNVAWYGAHTTEGQIVSRYPFIEHGPIDEAGNYWALIDLPDNAYGVNMGLVSAHPPCCDKEKERQQQLDGIAAWLRDRKSDETSSLSSGTPLVVAGDMNLVGGSRQLRTLLAGEIVYTDEYGDPHAPDWDGTALADSDARHAGGFVNYTWRDSRSSFAPGKLDYIVYSDSVLEIGNAFVLATEKLDGQTLERYGLRWDDTLEASDHLPVVADFRPLVARGAAPESPEVAPD